jgi:hypothetical protein
MIQKRVFYYGKAMTKTSSKSIATDDDDDDDDEPSDPHGSQRSMSNRTWPVPVLHMVEEQLVRFECIG